jgi:hypothetical protein
MSTIAIDALRSRIDTALHDLRNELWKAMIKHPPMHSAHEGWSVIFEELEELREHVRADTGQTPDARKEAMQVAAMSLRYALDLCDPIPLTEIQTKEYPGKGCFVGQD